MNFSPVALTLPGVAPPTLNAFTRAHWSKYDKAKREWGDRFLAALTEADVPRGEWAGVLAEGRVTFGDRRRRDQGNHRFLLEKALGDALVKYGAIPDDEWGVYQFGNLEARYVKNALSIDLILFPR